MKRLIIFSIGISALVVAGGVVAGCGGGASGGGTAGSFAPQTARVVITHVVRGCHDWSVNDGPSAASQTAHLATGGTLRITDNDVMPHMLLQRQGPAAAEAAGANMDHMGAVARVSFPRAGVYEFTTKAGEDYPSAAGTKTVGADHTLQLKVIVAS